MGQIKSNIVPTTLNDLIQVNWGNVYPVEPKTDRFTILKKRTLRIRHAQQLKKIFGAKPKRRPASFISKSKSY